MTLWPTNESGAARCCAVREHIPLAPQLTRSAGNARLVEIARTSKANDLQKHMSSRKREEPHEPRSLMTLNPTDRQRQISKRRCSMPAPTATSVAGWRPRRTP